jgi:hypothetical protein
MTREKEHSMIYKSVCVAFAPAFLMAILSLAGCTSENSAQANACSNPWQAAGNNGGKVDRSAVAQSSTNCLNTH